MIRILDYTLVIAWIYLSKVIVSAMDQCGGGWVDEGFTSCNSAPDGLIRTGRDHSNERMDETAIQLRLNQELNPGPLGWKPSTLPLR